MAEQQTTLSAPFPAPPPSYKHFTKQNISRIRQLSKEAGATQSNGNAVAGLDILSLPPELRYLVPPSLPSEGKYRTFGVDIDLHAPDATLATAGIEQLYPSDASVTLNPQPHLLALTRSLLTTFLSLVGILSENPTEYYAERVESLQTIMYNVHDLINQYRPHQARESLLLMMEERIEKMRDEIQRISQAKSKVEEVVKGLGESQESQLTYGEFEQEALGENGDPTGIAESTSDKIGRQRAAWAAIELDTQDAT